MKKLLFAVLATLTLGLFTSCIYDNPIDDGSGNKVVTNGYGGGPIPYEVTPASLFSPNFKTPYDIVAWATDWNPADPFHPTCYVDSINFGKIQLADVGYCGGTVGAGQNLDAVYDLSQVAKVTYSLYFPQDMSGKITFKFGGDGATEFEFYEETALKGVYTYTVESEDFGDDDESTTLFSFGAGDIIKNDGTGPRDNLKSFYIFNITFYDSEGNEITEFPTVTE